MAIWVKDDTTLSISGNSPEIVINQLQEQARNIFKFFASNSLVANPTKTAFMLFRPKGKKNNGSHEVSVGKDIKIAESTQEKVLGLTINNNLNWNDHIKTMKRKINLGLHTLGRLKKFLAKDHLNTISHGLIMSHIRYCSSVYLSDKVRVSQEGELTKELKDLQKKQNQMLRTILNLRIKDRVSVKIMLEKTNNLSVNQIACLQIVMDTWKALKLNIHCIKKHFETFKSNRMEGLLKANQDPFTGTASKLWNMAPLRVRTTNLYKVARREAEKFIKESIPI